jgi:hypothetical protein
VTAAQAAAGFVGVMTIALTFVIPWIAGRSCLCQACQAERKPESRTG